MPWKLVKVVGTAAKVIDSFSLHRTLGAKPGKSQANWESQSPQEQLTISSSSSLPTPGPTRVGLDQCLSNVTMYINPMDSCGNTGPDSTGLGWGLRGRISQGSRWGAMGATGAQTTV